MLDTIDLKIVQRLMVQGRATWSELASLLGLSAPAAAERVRKLEERAVIKQYSAIVDPEAVDLGLAAFIAVFLARPEHRENFLATIKMMPQVLECHHIAGDEDYILKVRCQGTRDLEVLVSEKIKGIPGVIKTRTTIILSTIKETAVLPLSFKEE